jgi:hypothetical protein
MPVNMLPSLSDALVDLEAVGAKLPRVMLSPAVMCHAEIGEADVAERP